MHESDQLMSVVTPAHNEERYLRRVVESVAEQTVSVYEHIVINDGSTDGSAALLSELSREYPHLVVVSQRRSGAAIARNRGIDLARGKYIAFLDADDVWHRRKVERQVEYMEAHNYFFTFGDYEEVDHVDYHRLKRYHLPSSVGHVQLLRGCPIGCLTAAYNQHALGKHYMPEVPSGHDWGLWLELTRHGIRGRKYPGLEASYTNGRPSLSSRKLRKVFNVYHIYRESEGLPRARAMFRTVEHSWVAAFKKAGLLYG